MEITRTTKLRLDMDVPTVQRTVEVWSSACNYISRAAFERGCLSNAVRLHSLVYQDVRRLFGLSAQVTQNAIRHVAAKYASARTAKKTLDKPVFFS
jgi:putative transposase